MDWDNLRYLLAVVDTGTLTKAADKLGVARTTVGRRLDSLEESLGVRLFDRTPDGFVPTAAGLDLARVGRDLEAEVLAAQSRVLGRDAELEGRLRVATLDFVFQGFVGVFHSFSERYPLVEVTVCSGYENVSLRRREADVALRLGPSPGDHLVGRMLGEIEFGLYAHKRLVPNSGTEIDFNTLPFVCPDERSGDTTTEDWIAEHAPRARIVMRFDVYPLLRTAVRQGIGAHLLYSGDGDADPNLVRLDADLLVTRMKLWVLTLPELTTNMRVRAFMDHAHQRLGPLLKPSQLP